MKEGLVEINQLVGIWGSLICDNQGEIILGNTPPGLNKSALENINRNALSMFSSANGSIPGISEAVLHFEERKLFVLDLEKVFLIVFCTPSVDISLLRMTINVLHSRWEGDPMVQKEINKRFVERI